MSGKAYTMKEMKTIVEYLTEHKAYNEIKGRKMWVDFERSKIIDRTWQSLKETFLKRILPDIHNPYYQLSVMQISSFRNGCDVEAKINNKLEIRTVSEESNASIEQAITEHPSPSNGNASGKKSGEDILNTKTISQHRSSAETVVIDTCYDTAEEIQNELEGNKDEGKNNSNQSAQKSLRDFITYSEPLTPMLQEVIDDFVTDEESDSGTKMEIVEDVNAEKSKTTKETIKAPIEISSDSNEVCNQKIIPDQSKDNTENRQGDEVTTDNREQLDTTDQEIQNAEETSVQEISSTEDVINVQSSTDLASKQVCVIDTDKNITEISTSNNVEENKGTQPKLNKSDKTNNIEEIASTQNTSTNTIDSIIPNNQEALNTQTEVLSITKDNEAKTADNDKEPETKSTDKDKEMQSKSRESNKRKRATSQDPTVSKIKKHLLQNKPKPVSVSDTDVGLKQSEKQLTTTSLPDVYQKPKTKKQKISDTENKESVTDKNTKGLEKVTEVNEEVISTIEVIPEIHVIKHNSPEIENPCLKSVSLYEEQFTSTKYGESSDAGVPEEKANRQEEKNKEIIKINSDNEILQLNTESETEHTKRKRVHTVSSKSEKEKDLANMFGFSSGAITQSRKRRRSYKKSSHRQSRTRLLNSDSSEWTSESEREYVSPPRGRKDRHSKKQLKPKSARIFSLEEEGGLFVMYGKKIYPIVKDGKLVKNYVNYTPERDLGDEDDSYWKHKYIEEKKRTAQLTKLLHQSENIEQPSNERCPEIDLTRASPPKKPKMSIPQTETNSASFAIPENVPNDSAPGAQKEVVKPKETEVQNKTVKIKITKQNEEVELEGHWSQLHPVLDHVVQIFHKEVAPKSETKCTAASEQSKVISLSGLSTPIIPHTDPVVQEKVRKLETEIFQEIEARDKQINRSDSPQSITTDSSKVTKRNEQPRRSKRSIASGPSTPEVNKSDLNSPSKAKKEQNVKKMSSNDVQNDKSPTAVARRITRTSKNALRESTDKNESKVNTRAKKGSEPSKVAKEETDVGYKFPSPPPSGKATRSAANRTTKLTKTKNI